MATEQEFYEKVTRLAGEQAGIQGGIGGLFLWVAGPFDEDMQGGDITDIHAEIANVFDLVGIDIGSVLAALVVVDLDCCEVIGVDHKKFNDCHAWLKVDTKGKEHVLAAIFVQILGTVSNNLIDSISPFVVTVYGRNDDNENLAAATYRHEELVQYLPLQNMT